MRTTVFLATCLSFASHGRRVQRRQVRSFDDSWQRTAERNSSPGLVENGRQDCDNREAENLEPQTDGNGSSLASWSLVCRAEDIELKINSTVVTAAEANAFAGNSFIMEVGPNLVEFTHQGLAGVEIILNRSPERHVKSGKVDLHFNKHGCCVNDRCLKWPTRPPSGWGLAFAPLRTVARDDQFSYRASWSLSCEVEDLELKINGKILTAAECNMLGGRSFVAEVGPNLVEFVNKGLSGVEITLNRSPEKHNASGKVEFHVNKYACCVGDSCVRWPDTIPVGGWHAASKLLPMEGKEDEDLFFQRVKEQLGGTDFSRLVSLLGSSAESPTKVGRGESSLHSDKVKELHSKQQLQHLFESAGDKLVVIDFWAPWCIPCKQFTSFFHKQAEDYSNADVVFGKLNIQETNALHKLARDSWAVETLPSILFVKNGKVVNRLTSASQENFLKFVVDSRHATVPQNQVKLIPHPTDYDLIVIGGGSGGLAAAKEAAKHGARVALFDFVKPSPQGTHWGFGGTCVNVGCIPKKLMHYAALAGAASKDAVALGWNLPERPSHDWEKMVATVQGHVKKLNFIYENGIRMPEPRADGTLPHAGIWYYNALARFEAGNAVSWKDDLGKRGVVTGSDVIVAAGCRPLVPDIPGKDLAITSDDLFSLERSPGKVLCVGAGYVALELGGILTNLGYETHIAMRSSPLRVGFDQDATDLAVELMRLQGTRFWRGWNVKRLEKDGGRIKATMYDNNLEETVLFDTVLYATGRKCNIADLNLEAAGVKTDAGKILVDKRDSTSAGRIYAIGDVAKHPSSGVSGDGNLELSPVAIQSGEMLARRLFAGGTELMDHEHIPTTVFTPFEISSLGLAEQDAIAKYGQESIETYIKVYKSFEIFAVHRHTAVPYREKDWDDIMKVHVDSERQTTDFPANAMAKLVCLRSDNDRIIGLHYVGPNAGEVTQGFAVAMRRGATKADFDATVGIHPTDAESFTRLETTKSSGKNWMAFGGCGGGKCG